MKKNPFFAAEKCEQTIDNKKIYTRLGKYTGFSFKNVAKRNLFISSQDILGAV